MANKNPSVTYSVTFSREPTLNSITVPAHIKRTAVPATRLVASPPLSLNKIINSISIRKATGVRIARIMAVLEYVFFPDFAPFSTPSAFSSSPAVSSC